MERVMWKKGEESLSSRSKMSKRVLTSWGRVSSRASGALAERLVRMVEIDVYNLMTSPSAPVEGTEAGTTGTGEKMGDVLMVLASDARMALGFVFLRWPTSVKKGSILDDNTHWHQGATSDRSLESRKRPWYAERLAITVAAAPRTCNGVEPLRRITRKDGQIR
jgi:hypothetical protein